MAINMMRLSAIKAPTRLNFGPISQAVDSIRQQKNQNAMMEMQRERMDMQREQHAQNMALAAAKLKAGDQPPWWAGKDGSVHPAMLAKERAGAPQTVNNMSIKHQDSFDKAAGKGLFEEYKKYQELSTEATNTIGQLDLARKAIADPNLYTGRGGEFIHGIKTIAGDLLGFDVQGTTSGEIVRNLGTQIALSHKDKLPGPLSNSDVKLLQTLPPGLSKSKAANDALIRIAMTQREYQIAIADAANDYASKNGGRLNTGWYQVKAKVDRQFAAKYAGLTRIIRKEAKNIKQASPMAGMPGDLVKAIESGSLNGKIVRDKTGKAIGKVVNGTFVGN